MTKMFKDSRGQSREPCRYIGSVEGRNWFESTSVFMTHLIRIEKGRSVCFAYDPGKVRRHLKAPAYQHHETENRTNPTAAPRVD